MGTGSLLMISLVTLQWTWVRFTIKMDSKRKNSSSNGGSLASLKQSSILPSAPKGSGGTDEHQVMELVNTFSSRSGSSRFSMYERRAAELGLHVCTVLTHFAPQADQIIH